VRKAWIITSILLIFVLAACGGRLGGGHILGPIVSLEEDRSVYDQDTLTVLRLNVSVLPGGATIEEVDADDDWRNPKKTTALVQVEEPGNEFSDGSVLASAKLRIRGHSSRLAELKSYRIKLDNVNGNKVFWRNLRTIQLNKSPYDLTRLRAKLSFDFFKTLPNMTSIRTLFVHLFIDGVDYGLYTVLERGNEEFLKAHGLDDDGWLYKAESFEFFRYPDQLKNTTDPDYNEEAFESILEIRGERDNHTKLISMLEEVNDLENDINTVISENFQIDNYLTWFATNIILENDDTNTQNFFLYNPTTSWGWYFLPWDYDGAWDFYGQPREAAGTPRPRWTEGVSNWWNVILHKRFLMAPGNIDVLRAKVEELRSFYTETAASTMMNTYRDIAGDIITQNPDLDTLETLNATTPAERIEQWNTEVDRIPTVPEQKYQEFIDTLQRPMPVFLAAPVVGEDGTVAFAWDESFDFQGNAITYDFQISNALTFDAGEIVFERLGRTETSIGVDPADIGPAGTYYFRVTIRDSEGNWQYPFDSIEVGDNLYDGMREFTLN